MTRALRTTAPAGLDTASLPWRLFQKAKRHGIWNPSDIDFAPDRDDWRRLAADERDLLLRLTAQFQAGEESVTLDLLPLVQRIASEGRLEEEMFLTSFLWEEAKHVELFRRFLDEVAEESGDLTRFHGPSYHTLVYDELPRAMGALSRDPSPEAVARASVTYNMIVEGVLAETGYHGYFRILESRDLLPGIRRGVALLKQDESRHIAYGVHLLCRLVAEHGEPVQRAIRGRMEELLPHALGVVGETFAAYDPIPFGVDPEEFVTFAMTQFQRRLARIENAGGADELQEDPT
ncbi:MAG: R2-like ligand-binding oxidase [Thermoanaerobaculia bacterium]